ncbi:unnamed protein product [Protopolystoma xenopodis]|uniref:Uncharacterized protein n=1 Tax=Protopolystoma xenopodis TaxID=117903 RepID=A0A3S5CGJ6_9PLAT|nr:unnamed protein product [Protopolystoma xenopodis]
MIQVIPVNDNPPVFIRPVVALQVKFNSTTLVPFNWLAIEDPDLLLDNSNDSRLLADAHKSKESNKGNATFTTLSEYAAKRLAISWQDWTPIMKNSFGASEGFCCGEFWGKVSESSGYPFEDADLAGLIIGHFVSMKTGRKLTIFTLADVAAGRIGFHHEARVETNLSRYYDAPAKISHSDRRFWTPHGCLRLTISDGVFSVSRMVIVNVTKPMFVVLPQRVPIDARSGKGALVTFEVITNMNVDPTRFKIELIHPPLYGILYLASNDEFTQEPWAVKRLGSENSHVSLDDASVDLELNTKCGPSITSLNFGEVLNRRLRYCQTLSSNELIALRYPEFLKASLANSKY